MYPFLERGITAAKERRPLTPITLDEANILNGWPEGTIGHLQEKDLFRRLLELSRDYGIGRIAQVTALLADMINDPQKSVELAQLTQDQIGTILRFREEMRESITIQGLQPHESQSAEAR